MSRTHDLPRRALPILAGVLCALVFADYLYTAWTWLTWNKRSGFAQDAWMQYALSIREGSSVAVGNDHPLYPAVLSLWVSRAPAAFTLSKLFSFLVGAVTLAAQFRIGRELFGTRAALIACALLSVNWIFLYLSMSIRAEVLLPLFFLMTWYAVQRGFEGKGAWWLAGGVWAGLTYLTKGTGTLLAIAWACGLAVPLLGKGDRRGAGKSPWFLAGFIPLAAILWWANQRMFGDPFYNFSIRHAMWLDSWWDLPKHSLDQLSFSGYVASHGWSGVLARLGGGIARFIPVVLSCLSPAKEFPFAYLLRWPLFLLALAALWTSRKRISGPLRRLEGGAWFTVALFALFFLLFAWYHQVSPSERFVGPLNPIVFLLLGAAGARLGEKVMRRLEKLRDGAGYAAAGAAGVGLILLASIALKAAEWGIGNPFRADEPPECYRKAYEWVAGRSEPVLYGPSGDLPIWSLRTHPVFHSVPERPAPESLAAWLDGRGIRAAVVDWDMASLPFLRGHFENVPERGVRMTRPLPGWRLVLADAWHDPPHLLILERR
ncbi:MAG: hypothetical protein A2X36_03640 [Elusimicrobia bacterium GWA2_69_24]|nr:MAG: hypothetical protein A2X36_03640 [Elusimicrobia bacterium GWA2_69_24]